AALCRSGLLERRVERLISCRDSRVLCNGTHRPPLDWPLIPEGREGTDISNSLDHFHNLRLPTELHFAKVLVRKKHWLSVNYVSGTSLIIAGQSPDDVLAWGGRCWAK